MLKNYFKIALRNLLRHKGYSFINVAGLAVGMVCCLLIGLYVEDELSFDRFHENVDRLFVVMGEHPVPGRTLSTPYSLASTLQVYIPEIERATRVWEGRALPVIREETQFRVNRRVLLVESSFFEMFSFPALAGDPAAILEAPDAAVITEAMARTFFGEEYPIGKTLTFYRFGNNVHTVKVGAVVKDVPANSSLQFDLVAPLSLLGEKTLRENEWGFQIVETYIQTTRPFPAKAFSEKINTTLQKHLPAAALEGFTYSALQLPALHLSGLNAEGLQGRPKYLYIFGSVALLVLLIAAVNYINLVTAQAMQRAREVGVRKTLGAGRLQLARQFLGESFLLSLLALVLALTLMELALPAFNRLFDKELAFTGRAYGLVLPLLCGFVLLVAITAGSYPAFIQSRFQPTEVLRGTASKAAPSGSRILRQSLVVLQFTISTTFIIGTTVIYRQLNYIQEKNLGFSNEQVVVVDLPESLSASVRETLKQHVLSSSDISRASIATGVPSRFMMGLRRPVAEVAPQARTNEERIRFMPAAVDYDFIPTLGLSLLAGRNFSDRFPTDVSRAYVLNKTAVERLGWSPEEAVGKSFVLGPPGTLQGEIIGVVDDFHITSLHQEIQPVVLQLYKLPFGSLPYVLIAKLTPGHIRAEMKHIEQQFSVVAPGASFQYAFLDDVFDQMYRAEERLSRIFTAFAALAVFIACLGLFGLAAFTAERRTKEIGIRKVMGATATNIVSLLSKDFIKLIVIAFVIATPPAYFAMKRWLEDFAYRIEIGPGIFLLTGALVLLIALLTVSYQALKAAMANPVDSLRYE